MISKFANTQYIVEEYRKKACNYIIANYFVDGLMDQSSEPKKWNDYVALFKEENLAGNIKPATVSTILELLKTHLRYHIISFFCFHSFIESVGFCFIKCIMNYNNMKSIEERLSFIPGTYPRDLMISLMITIYLSDLECMTNQNLE